MFSFHDIEGHIEQMSLGSCQALSDLKHCYSESYYRSYDESVPYQGTPVALDGMFYTTWKAAGYTVGYEDCRTGEKDTVLISSSASSKVSKTGRGGM